MITIYGSGFKRSRVAKVRFATEAQFDEVDAEYVSESMIRCVSPPCATPVRFGVRALGEYLDDLGVPTARRGEQRRLTGARASQGCLHVDVVERPLDRRWIRGHRGDVQQRAAANVGFVEVSYGLPQSWW